MSRYGRRFEKWMEPQPGVTPTPKTEPTVERCPRCRHLQSGSPEGYCEADGGRCPCPDLIHSDIPRWRAQFVEEAPRGR